MASSNILICNPDGSGVNKWNVCSWVDMVDEVVEGDVEVTSMIYEPSPEGEMILLTYADALVLMLFWLVVLWCYDHQMFVVDGEENCVQGWRSCGYLCVVLCVEPELPRPKGVVARESLRHCSLKL